MTQKQTGEQPTTPVDWADISRRLQDPFDPSEVDFRAQGRPNDQTGKAQVVAYIDARAVQDRLDSVVGAGNWSFDWTPLVIENGEVMVAKGTLTIHGVSKSDVGSASNFEQTLGTVSHCFKRAAVHWGIGRYLYNLPATWVSVERGGRISDQVMRELRAKLPRSQGQAQQPEMVTDRVTDESIERRPNPQPERAPAKRPAGVIRETPGQQPAAQSAPAPQASGEPPATEQQLVSIRKLYEALHRPQGETPVTYAEARQLITQLSAEYQRMRRAS